MTARWTAICVSILSLGCGGMGTNPGSQDAAGIDAGPPAGTLVVPAGPEAQRLGVEAWWVSWEGGSTLFGVELRGPGDSALGRLDLTADALGGFIVTFSGPDGASFTLTQRAEIRTSALYHETLLEGDGRSLAIKAWASASATDPGAAGEAWFESVEITTPLPADAAGPSVGWFLMGADEVVTAGFSVLTDDGAPASASEIALWLDQVGLDDLMARPGIQRTLAAFRDEALLQGMEQVSEPARTETDRNALSVLRRPLSPGCAWIQEKAAMTKDNAKKCCDLCTQANPDDAFILGEAVAIGVGLACRCCATAVHTHFDDMVECARQMNPESWTDPTCQGEYGPEGEGVTFTASDDGTRCVGECLNPGCQTWCREGVEVPDVITGKCNGKGECECDWDVGMVCEKLHGDLYCKAWKEEKGGKTKLKCLVQSCGDGKLTTECERHPERTEACDPKLEGGCGEGLRCTADCSGCLPCPDECQVCQCTPGDPEGCGEVGFCTEACTCEVPCVDSALDFWTAEGAWCDPAAAAAWCGEGGHCDADSCRCAICGDGNVEGNEECEAGYAGAGCPGDQPCIDCKCTDPCGNGVKDPGEHCDPPGTGACDDGYECSESCDCVMQEGPNPDTVEPGPDAGEEYEEMCGIGCELCFEEQQGGDTWGYYICAEVTSNTAHIGPQQKASCLTDAQFDCCGGLDTCDTWFYMPVCHCCVDDETGEINAECRKDPGTCPDGTTPCEG